MLLYRALDVVMPRFRRIFSEHGLTEQQWRVLRVLWEYRDMTFRDLCAVTLIQAPSMVGVVDRLTKKGLVERRASETDRRSVHVRVTKQGKALERRVRPAVEAAYGDLRDSMDIKEWDLLVQSLERVVAVGDKPDEPRVAARN
jgi:homoprotocatechuate degradation regulator HpaR